MKKIAVFQKDLGIGGIQRSLLNLLTNTDLSHYEVDLFLFAEPEICRAEDIHNVNIHILKPLFFLNRIIKTESLEKMFCYSLPDKEYDLAIDFNSYSNECAICTFAVNAKKRLMWIHNDVEIEYKNTFKYRVLWSFFKGKFSRYDEFVAVSQGIVEPFRRMTGIYDKKITVIPNPINASLLIRKSRERIDFKVRPDLTNFIFAGRFTKQKGLDILLDYFEKALEIRQDIHLYLLGSGSDELKIAQLIEDMHIGEFVTIIEAVENPYPYMAQMDALILTSRHEGQGMVLWEAKALGLDLIFEKHLEKYNDGLTGSDDIVHSIVTQRKHVKHYDSLDTYNLKIKNSIYDLFDKA
ncbi:MAG: glycosyltransferase [Clostridiales bacterium]|nr:glycosyltransferase [Clostridiales bacterium]MCD7827921.1 glycosyltransferase [Clostridiales bacterium]